MGEGDQEFCLGHLGLRCLVDIQVEMSNWQLVIEIQRRGPDWRYKSESPKHTDDDLSLENG